VFLGEGPIVFVAVLVVASFLASYFAFFLLLVDVLLVAVAVFVVFVAVVVDIVVVAVVFVIVLVVVLFVCCLVVVAVEGGACAPRSLRPWV
jgi:hypothetical protein